MSDIKLYYFNARGRAELVRLVLAASGKAYEDVRFEGHEDWAKNYKSKAPFGQAPFMEMNGKKFGQSVAMAAYFAREAGMYGKTNMDALVIDQVVALVQDLIMLRVKAHYEKDEAEKAKLTKKLEEEDFPRFMGYFEKAITENGNGYFVGNSVSLADLAVFDALDMRVKAKPDCLAAFPQLAKNRKNVESLDGVANHLKNRPVTEM